MKKILSIFIIGMVFVSFGCKRAEVKKVKVKKDNSKVLKRAQENQKELTNEVDKY
ncbi:hypothetical protein [Haliovirga abyssi]|uniref:Uncharacterized protein n=1 Tax=Haliovirga abyssi TaxID=2996794 RepID=A0AAU9D4Z8_9FUSO|nr:hypothetical protein [Haliovirga abyssi]BDU51049.1 hypothetical protein HLVA_16180 [Haliovirga abyssi]